MGKAGNSNAAKAKAVVQKDKAAGKKFKVALKRPAAGPVTPSVSPAELTPANLRAHLKAKEHHAVGLETKIQQFVSSGARDIDQFLKGLTKDQQQCIWKRFEHARKVDGESDRAHFVVVEEKMFEMCFPSNMTIFHQILICSVNMFEMRFPSNPKTRIFHQILSAGLPCRDLGPWGYAEEAQHAGNFLPGWARLQGHFVPEAAEHSDSAQNHEFLRRVAAMDNSGLQVRREGGSETTAAGHSAFAEVEIRRRGVRVPLCAEHCA